MTDPGAKALSDTAPTLSSPRKRPVVLTATEQQDAGKLGLRCEAKSAEALSLVQGLLEDVVLPAWPADEQQRPSSLVTTKRALGALMADLLKLEADNKAGAFGSSPGNFTGLEIGWRQFSRVRNALDSAGLLKVQPGYQQLHTPTNRLTGGTGPVLSHGGQVARFRLTPEALERVQEAGVDRNDWPSHWGRAASSKPAKLSTAPVLILRSKAETVNGVAGRKRDLPVDDTDPRAALFVQDLKAHNAFVMAKGVTGIAFAGLRRIFNNGDQPGFAWQWGGRFFSQPSGEAYESMSGDERRATILIGGDRVGEADIRASHLSFLYALMGLPLDPAEVDPYAISGFDRDVVKLWVSQSIGSGKSAAKRWSGDAKKKYGKIAPGRVLAKDHPIVRVREAVLATHPLLGELGTANAPSFHDLLFCESETMRGAMAALRLEGIASLPVHDSLVVPVESLTDAAEALRKAFGECVGAITGKLMSVRLGVQLKAAEA